MREILFRGKITQDEWVYGFYENVKLEEATIHYINGKIVSSKTVGQFTGLTDKNGKKIFEGDIIRAITLDTGSEEIAVVCFGNFIDENNGDEYIGFYIEFDGIKTTATQFTQLAMEEAKNRIEVIGNIYDNPELLEAKDGSNMN